MSNMTNWPTTFRYSLFPFLYRKTGVYSVIHYFLVCCLLFVLNENKENTFFRIFHIKLVIL